MLRASIARIPNHTADCDSLYVLPMSRSESPARAGATSHHGCFFPKVRKTCKPLSLSLELGVSVQFRDVQFFDASSARAE